MEWTKSQQRVIDVKNKNILVSAAAGSGKTAVLVERIIKKITDKENPVNVDQMLICTFTKAAATQMREKIHKAIEKQIELNPDDEHLARQAGYIRGAQITTIDGFCSYLVRNYYDTIDLNPGFRIADETELSLIKEDVVNEVMEKWYTNAKQYPDDKKYSDFLDVVQSCSKGTNDNYITLFVYRLHNLASSHPDPYGFVNSIIERNDYKTLEDIDNSYMFTCIKKLFQIVLDENINNLKIAKSICEYPDGPQAYKANIEDDINIYTSFMNLNTYKEIYDNLETVSYSRFKAIKKTEPCDISLKELVKKIRDSAKIALKNFMKKYYYMKPERMILINNLTSDLLRAVARLTLDFMKLYDERKNEKGILDFSDIEHFALKILTVDGDSNKPSPVAQSLSEYFDEIFVDEYQDSNDVQEAILTAIAGRCNGKPKMFMVGDVKQSIYGFRMAKPDLFLSKATTYPIEELEQNDNIRIDLNSNFRSRAKVLDFCNFIFEKCMRGDVGRIEYDDKEKLHCQASYPIYDKDYCELMIYNTSNKDEDEAMDLEEKNTENSLNNLKENEDNKNDNMDNYEAQFRMIARKIKQLTDPDNGIEVTDTDKDGNQYMRKATYDDIVILFRTVSKLADKIDAVFSDEQVPVMVESSDGYYASVEIGIMLNLLRIINNPLQDIPLASVLRSPIGQFTNQELAIIKSSHKKLFLYECLKEYIADGSDSNISKKASSFVDMLNEFREWSDYMSIHELILKLYDVTGYYECVLAMVDGKRRRINLDMLVARAKEFENTSYNGLFNFVRFMDKMNKYTIDVGQANNEEVTGCVRVMTIHKSKGLEFPIVFVADIGKWFNTKDSTDKIVLHSQLGLGIDYINYEHRVKIKTLSKEVAGKMISMDNIDEELRVFYVALTRAKEKLILTGKANLPVLLEKFKILANKDAYSRISASRIVNLKSYMELIIMSLMQTKAMRNVMEELDILTPFVDDMTKECPIVISVTDEKMIKQETVIKQLTDSISADYIRNIDTKTVYNKEVLDELIRLDNIKVYEPISSHKSKVSVSELKMKKILESEDIASDLELHMDKPVTSYLEDYDNMQKKLSQDESIEPTTTNLEKYNVSNTQRGTMYHKLFEILPLEKAIEKASETYSEFESFLEEVVADCKILENWKQCIKVKDIIEFAKSDLAKRMCKAYKNNQLYCEQPFFLGVGADEIYDDGVKEENVIVQGIIDVFFFEGDNIILMDYKTDSIKGLSEEEGKDMLSKRYKTQLDLYARAIENATDKKVTQKLIYSVALGQQIDIIEK